MMVLQPGPSQPAACGASSSSTDEASDASAEGTESSSGDEAPDTPPEPSGPAMEHQSPSWHGADGVQPDVPHQCTPMHHEVSQIPPACWCILTAMSKQTVP